MSIHGQTPGGRAVRWLYGLATGLALFSGLAQMPMMKRYYLADLPGLAWTDNFYVTSNLHYLAASLLLAILAWRLGLSLRQTGGAWTWGPRGWWGWGLLTVLVVSGAAKVINNAGLHLAPDLLRALTLTHLGAAMVFLITGLLSLLRGRRAQ